MMRVRNTYGMPKAIGTANDKGHSGTTKLLLPSASRRTWVALFCRAKRLENRIISTDAVKTIANVRHAAIPSRNQVTVICVAGAPAALATSEVSYGFAGIVDSPMIGLQQPPK